MLRCCIGPRRTHRGACGCEANTGDGAGILLAMPDQFFSNVLMEELDVKLPALGEYAVAQVFLPQDEGLRLQARKIIEDAAAHMGHDIITWRAVPTNNRSLGLSARKTEPVIEQLFLSAKGHLQTLEVEQQVRFCGGAAHALGQLLLCTGCLGQRWPPRKILCAR